MQRSFIKDLLYQAWQKLSRRGSRQAGGLECAQRETSEALVLLLRMSPALRDLTRWFVTVERHWHTVCLAAYEREKKVNVYTHADRKPGIMRPFTELRCLFIEGCVAALYGMRLDGTGRKPSWAYRGNDVRRFIVEELQDSALVRQFLCLHRGWSLDQRVLGTPAEKIAAFDDAMLVVTVRELKRVLQYARSEVQFYSLEFRT